MKSIPYNNYKWKIDEALDEALEILCQSLTRNRDHGFELFAQKRHILTRDLAHPSSREK